SSHPEAVHLLALVALETQVQAGKRGDGARGADQVHRMRGDHLAELVTATKLAELRSDKGDHGLEGVAADIDATEPLGDRYHANRQGLPGADRRCHAAVEARAAAAPVVPEQLGGAAADVE